MSSIERWSSSESDVDPVMRSLFRYARDIEPSSTQIQSLLQRLDAAPGAQFPDKPATQAGRLSVFKVLGGTVALMVSLGGLAFIGYQRQIQKTSAPASSLAPHCSASASFTQDGTTSPNFGPITQPVSSALSSNAAPNASAVARRIPSVTASHKLKCAADLPISEAELLHQARVALRTNPSAALTLTQQHAGCFPRSSLIEERDALRAEALYRLGRANEANRAREAFETRFPDSPYRPRLRSLVESQTVRD